MVLSQSERISQLLDNSRKFVSRNKVRDSSELTLIHQAKGSHGFVSSNTNGRTTLPQIVEATANPYAQQLIPSYQELPNCAAKIVYTGVGTGMDQTAILHNKQKAAICADDDPAWNPYIILPVPKCSNLIPVVKTNYGGSLYFDGSTSDGISRLITPNSVDFQLDISNPDFTIEWFQYATPGANESAPRIFSIGNNTPTEAISFYETYNSGTNQVQLTFLVNGTSTSYDIKLNTAQQASSDIFNKWIHIAVERYGGDTTIYINGNSEGSTSSSYTVTNSVDDLIIGANWNYGSDSDVLYLGYLTNFRWTKGVAVYQGNFTVPTKPLPALANTVLLLDVATEDTATKDTGGLDNPITNVGVVYNYRDPFH